MPRKTLIKHRRDTKANWKSANPVLDDGEPGVETDTNRTKVGNGTTSWNSLQYQNVPFYGAFIDTTNQTVPNATTAVAMKLNTTELSKGVSVVTNGTGLTRITFTHGGVYNLQWSGQFINTDNNITHDVAVWLRKNGSDISGTASHISVPGYHSGVNGSAIGAWNYFISVTDGQYVELMWHASNTAVSLSTIAAETSPVVPIAASVIVTVQQVA